MVHHSFNESLRLLGRGFDFTEGLEDEGVALHRSIRAFGRMWACFIGEWTRCCLILLDLLVYYLANSLDNHGGDVGATY